RVKEMAIADASSRGSSRNSVSSSPSTNNAGIPAFIMIPDISIRNLSPNSAGLLPSIKSAVVPALTTVSQPQLSLAGFGDVSVSTQGSSNKGRSNQSLASYGNSSVSNGGSSVSSSSISTVTQNRNSKMPAVIKIVRKMESKPPALVKNSIQIPPTRATAIGGGDDESIGSTGSAGSINNIRGIHNIKLDIPLILQDDIWRFGHDNFLDDFGNRMLPAQTFEKSDGGLCWAATMAMTGYINTSLSPPSYINVKPEAYHQSINRIRTNYKNHKGLSPIHEYNTQKVTLISQYVDSNYAYTLTPKIVNKLLNKYDKGVIAGIYTGMIKGNTPTGSHAVLLIGVKDDKVIYNDPNEKEKQEITIDQFNKALQPQDYTLLGKKGEFPLPITTNRYTSGINLKDTPNNKIRQHIIDADQKHIAFIKNDTNTSRSEIFKETLDFRSLLAQVDEVVRPRHNKAVEAGLVESRLAKLEGINDASLPLTDSTMSQTNEKLINNITTKNNIYKNILLEGLNNLNKIYLNQIDINQLSEKDSEIAQHYLNLYLDDSNIGKAAVEGSVNKLMSSPNLDRKRELDRIKKDYLSEYEKLGQTEFSLSDKLKLVIKHSAMFSLIHTKTYEKVQSKLGKKAQQKNNNIPTDFDNLYISLNKNATTKQEIENNILLIHKNNLNLFNRAIKNNNVSITMDMTFKAKIREFFKFKK
ncbi:MAG: hypothetical protein RI956_55, partial [Pseudomonadota bacterium]